MSNRFLVVGGDAAGMSAAGKARRDDPEREVVVFERGDWVSYGACGLPYFVKGVIADVEDLLVVEPRKIVEERGIDLRRHHEVVGIDRETKTITVENSEAQRASDQRAGSDDPRASEGERYEESYDDLLLATGGRAAIPDVPGTDLDGVFAVRNLQAGRALRNYVLHEEDDSAADARASADPSSRTPAYPAVEEGYGAELRSHLREEDVEVVAVVGANKIGVEMAEAFVARGFEVHVFEAGERALPVFGPDVANVVEDHLREQGVELHLGAAVERLVGEEGGRDSDGQVAAVETAETTVEVDAVLCDVGVEPNTDLAASAGVELGETGAIATDEYGRTNDEHVYAAGDCAEKHHLLTGKTVHWPYALAANRAGRAIGRTVAGTPTPTGGIVGTNVMKAFDLQLARTGLDEAAASEAGFEPVSTTVTTITRAHYYPGWERIAVHATADEETGRLLGATLVGKEGAAHRVNSVAAALHAGMTVRDVGNLDFGYAPPFGPVWDPVLLAAKALGDEME